MDKLDIIRAAENIGTYETSILPYEDCCVLFSPPHPVLRGEAAEAGALYEKLELTDLIDEALRSSTAEKCSYPQNPAHNSGTHNCPTLPASPPIP
jgi:thiamine biosynthesis protein ThiI